MTSAVGLFPHSRSKAFGLDDMAGNVLEWCGPLEAEKGSREVRAMVRGGAWGGLRARSARSAWRLVYRPDFRVDYLGFRVVRAVGVRTP